MLKMKFVLISILLQTYFAYIYCAKILLFVPGLSHSQVVFNYRVGDLLANAGHEVTLYRPLYNPDVTKGKPNSSAKELRFKAVTNDTQYRELAKIMESAAYVDSMTGGMTMNSLKMFNKIFLDGCENQITNVDLMTQLKEANYDLAIAHMYDFCPLAMIKALNIPTHIWMSSAAFLDHMSWAIGAPSPASFVPTALSSYGDRMNFVQRFKNFLGHAMYHAFVHYLTVNPSNELFRKHYGEQFPDVMQLAGKSPLVFINSEEFLDFPRPILHKVIYIGGIGLTNPKPLKDKWQQIMDDSKDGVVLFSFGSVANATAMPEEWKKAFLSSFKKFPSYTFVWKYSDPMPEAADVPNLILSSWIPQNDMFGHSKMRAFITHSGYNSLLEAANSGIPLIMIPLFGDQAGNRRRAERHGIGIGIDKGDLNKKHIKQALEQILHNSTYKDNAARLSRMIKKKPVKGEELAVKWVEFLAEHKQLPNLEPVSAEMGLIEYFLIDVFVSILLGSMLAIYIVYKISYLYFWWCFQTCFKEKRKID